jgi:hypothetical protein
VAGTAIAGTAGAARTTGTAAAAAAGFFDFADPAEGQEHEGQDRQKNQDIKNIHIAASSSNNLPRYSFHSNPIRTRPMSRIMFFIIFASYQLLNYVLYQLLRSASTASAYFVFTDFFGDHLE